MLGELICEGKGKTIGMRVLDDDGTMETTFQGEGTLARLNSVVEMRSFNIYLA
ncbi:MAG TPA: hypothetical protein VEG44_09590 [Candidatus Acidoferrales bacterium]|nr:hypothetical protein [Candidatus Acidoferrales bacterium]